MVGYTLAAAAVGTSLLLAQPELAESHAMLLEPVSRNYVANIAGNDYCPHCLQAGGPDAVKARGNHVWPTALDPASHGLCGDPGQSKPEPAGLNDMPYLVPTPVQKTYQAGEIVEFWIGINAHHRGHYEFRICDFALDGSKLVDAEEGQKCLNKWVLERAPLDASCGNGNTKADCQPIDENHPGRWYLPPPSEGTFVAGPNFNDENVPNAVTEYHVMKYRIPDGFSCTHCTLQWYWATGNSCIYDADYLGPDGYFQRNAATFAAYGWNPSDWCGHCMSTWATCDNACCKTGGNFGEEFWNCADIAVTGSGSTTSPASTTATTAATTAAPTTASTTSSTSTSPPASTTFSSVETTATTTSTEGPACTARAGNALFATNARCDVACGLLPAGVWPCNEIGPCDCDGSASTATTSTTMATTTATAATTTTTPGASCSGRWGQCGGQNWNGATCCTAGNACKYSNPWYSQCLP
eukprot:TRINITY_DN13538_c0_g1_i2.p1 TRINITY_DN13538_c0_g1~~TRINITY_DN13538_c0_g1_i2.p1  ORF type:complete len:469 (+),score=75.49 TRINITY_DN13538_c0_g1_i2:101-1507(+)